MLRISKLTDYAIIILGHMARAPGRTYAANELAEAAHVAAPTVSKVLKTLTRADVVRSTRGAKGGYQLTHAPGQTTVASCHVRGNWSVLNRAIQTALEAVTLADMANPMTQAPDGFSIPLSRISVQPRRHTE